MANPTAKLTTRQALDAWDQYRINVSRETPLPRETPSEKVNRIERLEANPEEWIKYHFPHYAYAEPASFHKAAFRRLLKKNRCYDVRAWSRELAKSTRSMLEFLYIALVTKKAKNLILVSHNESNAQDLLMPFAINLESNQRLINDYGTQKGFSNWEKGNYKTRNGISMRAVGGGQSPRGSRNEHSRPDYIIIDDLDNDKICKNPDLVRERWHWVEQALIPTISVSGNYWIVFNGNIIAPVCVMKFAIDKAKQLPEIGHVSIVNIRDADGKSTWPDKNSEPDIDDILSLISYISQQKEYFNNPIVEGTTFKKITWGKVPPLTQYKYLVNYGDPSYKETKKSDYKAGVLVGEKDGKFYVITAFVQQSTMEKFLGFFYDVRDMVTGKASLYSMMEAGSLQDVFFTRIIMPIIITIGKIRGHLSLAPDHRAKTDKFTRIESTLQPLNDSGRLIFNEQEKDNPNMRTLEEQFLAITPELSGHDDGPDATEGAVSYIQTKLSTYTAKAGSFRRRGKKF